MLALLLLTVIFTSLVSAGFNVSTTPNPGGTSIAGMSVTCFSSMENCLEACYMSCYFADHCNDSDGPMIACAPGLRTMVILTLLCVIPFCCCCCLVCFCTPCCFCAVWLKRKRAARNRRAGERAELVPYGSAPPLLPKA